MTVIYNNDNILPLGKLDKTSIAVVNIGAPADNLFASTCARYARVDRFYTNGASFSPETLAKIKSHGVVIAAVYNDKSWARSTMAALKDCDNLVAVFMVNPYKMNKFAGSIKKAKALVLAYDDTPYIREYAAQAIFGGIDVDGTLPVNLKGLRRWVQVSDSEIAPRFLDSFGDGDEAVAYRQHRQHRRRCASRLMLSPAVRCLSPVMAISYMTNVMALPLPAALL